MKPKPKSWAFTLTLIATGEQDIFAWLKRDAAEDWRYRILQSPDVYTDVSEVFPLFGEQP